MYTLSINPDPLYIKKMLTYIMLVYHFPLLYFYIFTLLFS